MLALPTAYTVEEETTLVLDRPMPSQVTLKTSSLVGALSPVNRIALYLG